MAYDREHGVLTWGGTLPGGEIWTNSLRMAETESNILGGANDAAGWDMPALLAHYVTVLSTHHAQPEAFIHSTCKLTWVKFNRVNVDGRYIDPNTNLQVVSPVAGGRPTNQHPNQCCLVVSFGTAVSRGRASKGRLFAPSPAFALDPTARIEVNDALQAVGRYKATIEALSDVPGLDTADSPGAVIMSKVGLELRTRRISSVRIGRVLDTQRRRRGSMIEDYQNAVVDQGTY